MWADDSDEEEETSRPSFRVTKKVPKNYTAPVSFVSGGIQQAGKPKEEKKAKDDDEDEDDDDETGRPRRGDADYVPNSSR